MAPTQKHKIVAVDNYVPLLPLTFDHDLVSYDSTRPEQLIERIKDATIIITTTTPIPRIGIESAPNLQLVACNTAGFDQVDNDAARERGIALCHVPAQSTESVSEHAFALYYGLRRKIIDMHNLTIDGTTWASIKMPAYKLGMPRVNSQETLAVIGYGALGKHIEQIGKSLGMKVIIAERKGASEARQGRVTFEAALKEGTLFILVTPMDSSTRGMIGPDELALMDSTAFVINVGRGGVINEAALAKALKDGKIGGAATDVFEHEPATKDNCPLLDPSIPNLILSPHLAAFSQKTIQGTRDTVKANLEGFAAGRPQNVV